ncbi:MAG TPA: acyl-CoA dehydrogenase family protein [Miltoncostaeaceae bacterium]|nr:acyl-CoA dehydrogenase family protein [Miltoncostaeaceae bacterium]
MHVEPTEIEQDLRDLAREFARAEIAPHAERWNAEHHVPVDLIRRMGGLGLLGVTVPEEYGGAGLGQTAVCLVIEETAYADVGVSTAVAVQNGLGASPVVRWGDDAQRARLLPGIAAGETIACYALTEPDAGSDAAALRTAGTVDHDGAVTVSGTKTWITNGGIADVFVVFARTDGPGARGVTALVGPAGPGLTVSREIPKLGLHTSSTVELAFDGWRVGPEGVLGARGQGMRIALATLDSGRIGIAAQACGIARRALDVAVDYARGRPAFGGVIARFQGVQFPLAEVAAKLEAARLLTYHAAAAHDRGENVSALGAKAKLFASAVAVEAADVAVQTLGGYGYSAEYPAERLYRDARITQIYEGTSEIQRMVIARDLFGDAARG